MLVRHQISERRLIRFRALYLKGRDRMVCQVQKDLMRRRKQIRAKPIRRRCTDVLDVLEYIKELKLRVEAFNEKFKDICNPIQLPTEVSVKKVEKGFLIQISCGKGRDVLVTVLETFEEMGLNILHAKVSSDKYFSMDVLGQALSENLDPLTIQTAVLRALQDRMEDETDKNN